jgi:hypothetical protein
MDIPDRSWAGEGNITASGGGDPTRGPVPVT